MSQSSVLAFTRSSNAYTLHLGQHDVTFWKRASVTEHIAQAVVEHMSRKLSR